MSKSMEHNIKHSAGLQSRGGMALPAFLLVALLLVGAASQVLAQAPANGITHLRITSQVILPSVTRLGINLGEPNYFDSGQILKNLLYRNPGFEGLSYRSLFHCTYGGPGRCIDTRGGIQFPADFWDGASYEVIEGGAAGRKGTVAGGGPAAGGYGLALDSKTPAIGANDWIAVQKQFAGDPTAGWWTNLQGGAKLDAERVDLPPGQPGHQALRMTASGPGQTALLSSYMDSTPGMSFLHLHGSYKLSFRAKAVGGPAVLHVSLGRLLPGMARYLDKDVPLTSAWASYETTFTANEANLPPMTLAAGLSVTGGSLLLDDVDLEPVGGDATNHTVFRDEVVQSLRELHPGALRMMASYGGLGSTVDNLLAAPLARQRAGYHLWFDKVEDVTVGIPEFLELCQEVGAEPWIVMPTAMSLDESRKLAEYFTGSASTAGGAVRVAGGRRDPWTQAFRTIHLEFGNETWNAIFGGESMDDPYAYGTRANAVFTTFRAAAGADAGKFDLIVGTQAVYAGRNSSILAAASLANSLAFAPYLMMNVQHWANDDELFGPLMAQPEQMSRDGIVTGAQASAGGRQLAVYEVNLHTTEGDPPQAVLDRLTPSAAAGLAVTGHMLRMMRDHGIRTQMLFGLSQYQFRRADGKNARLWGAVVETGPNGRKRPQFLAESLANRVVRGNLVRVEVSGENPTHDQPQSNDNVRLAGVHEIDAYAFQDGNWHGLIVFNYGLHQARRISLEAAGLNANSAVKVARISANPGDTNEDSVKVSIKEDTLKGSNLTLAPCSMTVLEWQN